MNKRGTLVVLSGFSGVGKGTIVKELLQDNRYSLSISWTTRDPREGEIPGVNYHFKTDEEFEALVEADGFIEHAGYVGHYYGTPKKFVEDELAAGKTVILEIELQGARLIKALYPDAVMIFVTAPSAKDLEDRLFGRKTEEEEVVRDRLRKAVIESAGMNEYEYIVCNENGKVKECAQMIRNIIDTAACRIENQRDFITEIQEDLAKHFQE